MPSTQEQFSKLANRIETWFQGSARDFPWRKSSTPWGILVSEFMAQQTQITRVSQRWEQMMERFPTPKSMAEGELQDVLLIWQGLGYYRRARHLKAAAEMIASDFGGEVPSTVESLMLLPGVGRYTAGAVASIAFGKRVPIVDGNVHRVLCRLSDQHDEPNPRAWTWNMAEQFVGASNQPRVFNEALMEFGATVCTPKTPRCTNCPLQSYCEAHRNGTQNEVPQPKKSTAKQHVYHYSVILTHGDEMAFEQRGDRGLWAGMWQVPTVESPEILSVERVANELHILGRLEPVGFFDHKLTHRTISFTVFTCEINRENRFSWLNRDALGELPLASAQRKVLGLQCMT